MYIYIYILTHSVTIILYMNRSGDLARSERCRGVKSACAYLSLSLSICIYIYIYMYIYMYIYIYAYIHIYIYIHIGFYFVCFIVRCVCYTVRFCNCCFVPSRLNKMGQGGEEVKVTLEIVPFSVSVLAVVTKQSRNPHIDSNNFRLHLQPRLQQPQQALLLQYDPLRQLLPELLQLNGM